MPIDPDFLPGSAPPVTIDLLQQAAASRARAARQLADEALSARARAAAGTPGVEPALTTQFRRNEWVAEYARRRAAGNCELCWEPAPFLDADGEPILEVHHIQRLAAGGLDTIENTVVLCPNCHRKMHQLNRKKDQSELRKVTAVRR
jgi:5-methylcytosine-specific restriction protein A